MTDIEIDNAMDLIAALFMPSADTYLSLIGANDNQWTYKNGLADMAGYNGE